MQAGDFVLNAGLIEDSDREQYVLVLETMAAGDELSEYTKIRGGREMLTLDICGIIASQITLLARNNYTSNVIMRFEREHTVIEWIMADCCVTPGADGYIKEID